ncbi:hypothetical protein SAMN05421805_103205 [Saccharopolyspora antimicrobica]|uniref:Uncharacterized protein n=2 Tax=Saccharopolyspora TaxID=1835 RepID=A0A1I4X3W9_9PSEU|nr:MULTISPECIES: hypothetical protein [Saccharopolyspora]RKT84279.1 hypothetical protein ATL45_2589 [Saccharopolyspora antimicrobica]SEG84216.1 hypothetical protein SAMN02982929_04392 [Saccharopolyspora kobensis]SFD29234.1 hypothetical protein SAMN05216506_103399 [Saccharopolyspora kobensis]SFN20050.1 hypothetical protein SAMN05421805_103205 [Saccharopolyspora antimicrobica]
MSSAVELRAPGPRGIPPLFARLVDDASLFPPGAPAVPQVVADHLEARGGALTGLLGPILCQASRLAELITELAKAKPSAPVPLSLVCDTGLGGVPKALSIIEGRQELLALRMVEMPAPSDVDDIWLERVSEFVPEDIIRVVEPRRGGDGWLDGIRRVAEHGCWPKLRCGGQTAESVPSVDVVTDFLAVAASLDVPFKATTGLHTAVRGTDPETGFTNHGFLNLLVAAARSLSGKDVREALASTDGAALAEEAKALSDDAANAVRDVFASYGARSLKDPVVELEGLGLL